MQANKVPVVDAMQYSRPERVRFEEWRRGGVLCVHHTVAIWENARETIDKIAEWQGFFSENGDLIVQVKSMGDIERARREGKTAVILGFQNTAPLEDNLDLVEVFAALGVKIIQLTYNIQNSVGAGCWEPPEIGLSKHYGPELIREMNRAGILIDLSHCNEQTARDVINLSDGPVAITHANPMSFVGPSAELAPRLKSDYVIKALTERGGVIGLSMYGRMAGPDNSLERFLDMMAWTVELAGIEHVGIGSDFYTGHPPGIVKWWRTGRWGRQSPIPIGSTDPFPDWFRSPADFQLIAQGLRERGFSEEEVGALLATNWLRLYGRAFEGMDVPHQLESQQVVV